MTHPLKAFLVGSASWQGVPHTDAIKLVHSLGFGGVEVLSKPGHFEPENPAHVDEVGVALADWPDAIVTFHAPFHTADLGATDPAAWGADVAHVAQSLRAASTFRAGTATLHVRGRGEGVNWGDQNMAALRRALDALVPVAAECGITLSVENMPPDRFGCESEDLLALVNAYPPDVVGICFDTGHAHQCGKVIQLAGALARQTFVMHIHDNHGEKDQHNVPGRGTIPWPEVVRALQDNGYRGRNVLEVVERCKDGDTIDTVRTTLEAMKKGILETGLYSLNGSTK